MTTTNETSPSELLEQLVTTAQVGGWQLVAQTERSATLTSGGSSGISRDTHVLYAVGGIFTCGLLWIVWLVHVLFAGGPRPPRTLLITVSATGEVSYLER